MADEIRINYENGVKGRVPASYNQHLPSTELRGAISDWEDGEDIHLRDYLDVIIRRKWLIICILALSFITTLIFTLASTKTYKATTTIEVTQETPQVTKFEEVLGAGMGAGLEPLSVEAGANRVKDSEVGAGQGDSGEAALEQLCGCQQLLIGQRDLRGGGLPSPVASQRCCSRRSGAHSWTPCSMSLTRALSCLCQSS